MKINTKLKLISMFFCSFLIISLTFLQAAPSIQASNPTYMQTTTNVNFRSLASTASNIIRKLSAGTKLKVVGSIDNFHIVQLSTDEVGLVHKDYAKASATAPSGASTYTNLGKTNGTINTEGVNFRRGPSTSFSSIKKLAKNTSVTVIRKNFKLVFNCI